MARGDHRPRADAPAWTQCDTRPQRRAVIAERRPTRRGASLLCATFLLASTACSSGTVVWGSGRTAHESRSIQGFDSVALRGGGELVVEQVGHDALVVEAEESILPHIRTEVREGELALGPRESTALRANKPIRYRLTVRELRRLSVVGPATVEVRDLATPSLETVVAGPATVVMSGTASRQDITASRGATVDAGRLVGREATVVVPSAATVVVNAAERLEAAVERGGTVSYVGSPAVLRPIGTGNVSPAP